VCAPHEVFELDSQERRHWWLNYCPFLERVDAEIKALGIKPEQDHKKQLKIETKAMGANT
jgi:hypothetical protein